MLKHFSVILMSLALCWPALAVEEQHGIVTGVVSKVDDGAKTVVVKTADGTEHTFHFVKRSTVHGTEDTGKGAEDAFHGLKEGSEVAVHYTAKGGVETGEEFDRIGKDGLKATDVTVTHIDRGAKTLAVKTADGTAETFRLTASAAKDAGKDVVQGSEKSAKVTVYYTEESGRKIAHFFKSSN
jgi:arginine repressor